METTFWPQLAFVLIIFFFFFYSMLDGFDLGISIYSLFLKKREETDTALSVIAPFWDGNEVWLVMGAGFLFGAFPVVFGTLLSVLYLPFMVILLTFILRAVGIEYSYHDSERMSFWRDVSAFASLVAAFAGLSAIGLLMQGLPFIGPGIVSRDLRDYLSLFPLLFGTAGLLVVVWHGIAYLVAKHPEPGFIRAAGALWPIMLISVFLMGLSAFFLLPRARLNLPVITGGSVMITGLVSGRILLSKPGAAFKCSCLAIAGLWAAVGALIFPFALPAKGPAEWGLTLLSSASPISTLKPLCLMSLVLIPVILFYTFRVYCVFRSQTNVQVPEKKGQP